MSEDVDVTPKKASVQDILTSVNELNKQQIQSIYIPSVKDNVNFKPLTVKQQKLLLTSGVDLEIENLTFSNTINEIIMENCLSGKNEIKLTDRSIIVYQMREKAVGELLKFTDDETEYEVNLREHIDSIKISSKNPPTTFTIDYEGITIRGNVPDLMKDSLYNKQFTRTIKNTKRKTVDGVKLTDIVGDIYIHEMVKYVDSISINNQTLTLDTSLPVDQAISIFESLPMAVSKLVADKIKDCREIELDTMSTTSLPEDVQLPFDASLFTSE